MKWISVDRALPSKTGTYLIANSKGGVWIGFWIRQRWLDDDGDILEIDGLKITNWQEFPDPPNHP